MTRQNISSVFRLMADDGRMPDYLAGYAKAVGIQRVAVIDDRTAYGQIIADAFARAIVQAGGQVVRREFTHDRATDWTAILNTLKPAQPDAVFYGGMDSVAGPMLGQMRQMGINATLLSGDGICSAELPRLANLPTAQLGAIVCTESGDVTEEEQPRLDQFNARFKQRFGREVIVYAPYTYDAVMAVVNAMREAGSVEPVVYTPALRRLKHQGVTGPISFDARGDIVNAAVTLFTYEGQKRRPMGVLRNVDKDGSVLPRRD